VANDPYVMPKPHDIVTWTFYPGNETQPALVTSVGRSVISLALFPTMVDTIIRKECVRHISDPMVKLSDFNPEYGVWDYTEQGKQLNELLSALLPDHKKKPFGKT
jgi:hypothetical protein